MNWNRLSEINNYEFCAQWLLDQKPAKSVRVLDYGCGSGQIVNELRKHKVNVYGCDVFYEGGNYLESIDTRLLDDGIIRKMCGNDIPFDSASFDYIIDNQVMEHVENLDGVLSEIHRVLKPGGKVLNLFPDKSVWREGHCGIPFLHWFPRQNTARIYYAAGLRFLGFGYNKGSKGVMRWSKDYCEWLDRWTYYRPHRDIDDTYRKYFTDIQHIEDYWLQLRLGSKKFFVSWLPSPPLNLVTRKLCGMVFVARKLS